MQNRMRQRLYGYVAEFDSPDELLEAARKTKAAGFTEVRAFSPYYVPGLADILGQTNKALPYIVLIGIVVGASLGFLLQWYTDVLDYPVIIAGRPFNSWQAFLIISFELGILGGALAATGAMLIPSNLPLPYHPAFNTPNFQQASRSRFFLAVLTTDRRFHLQRTREFLEALAPDAVSVVPA